MEAGSEGESRARGMLEISRSVPRRGSVLRRKEGSGVAAVGLSLLEDGIGDAAEVLVGGEDCALPACSSQAARALWSTGQLSVEAGDIDGACWAFAAC